VNAHWQGWFLPPLSPPFPWSACTGFYRAVIFASFSSEFGLDLSHLPAALCSPHCTGFYRVVNVSRPTLRLPRSLSSPTLVTTTTRSWVCMMDLPPAWCQVCVCGRTFSIPQAYTCHKRSCQKTKKRLAGALEKAKETWQARKRRRTEEKGAGRLSVTDPEPILSLACPMTPEPVVSEVRYSFEYGIERLTK
jgi:hypothetical protein